MDRQHIKIAVAAIVAGTAITAGLVTARTAGAHGREARATLATADGTRVGSVEFNTNHGHTNATRHSGNKISPTRGPITQFQAIASGEEGLNGYKNK